MDTLIDNRNFPPEMQQAPEFQKEKKSTPWLLILLIVFAVGIIIFLICNIFLSRQRNMLESKTQGRTLEEKVETVNNFKKIPTMTKEQRDDAMYSFFNSK